MKVLKKILIILLCVLTFHLTGITSVTAFAAEVYRVDLDETYLQYAVVSDTPVELEGKVYNSRNNYVYEKTLVYSVTAGGENAEIRDGNQLYVLNAGAFTVRASLSDDANVYDEYECNAVELQFSDVRILSKIENVTVYTQPIKLMGTVTVEGIDFPETVHKEVCFEVVEGPADIFVGDYLRFNGAGTVVLKAYSRYNKNAFTTMTITVTDPDAGKDLTEDTSLEQDNLEKPAMGCSGSLTFGLGGVLFLSLGMAVMMKKKEEN